MSKIRTKVLSPARPASEHWTGEDMVHLERIELSSADYQSNALPLSYRCMKKFRDIKKAPEVSLGGLQHLKTVYQLFQMHNLPRMG